MINNVNIDKLIAGGRGISKSGGKTIFVEGVIDGESVDVEIIEERKKYILTRPQKILKNSPFRISPPCKYHFSVEEIAQNIPYCGGCSWQHIEYKHQLKLKKILIEDGLKRIGKLEFKQIDDVVPSAQIFRYRNKAQIPISSVNGEAIAGFFAHGTHEVVKISDCIIQPEIVFKITNYIRENIKSIGIEPYDEINHRGSMRNIFVRTNLAGELLVGFVSKEMDSKYSIIADKLIEKFPEIRGVVLNENPEKTNIIFGKKWEKLRGEKHLVEKISELGISLKISYGAFFQTNPFIVSKMYGYVASHFADKGLKKIFDLYSGVGGFALSSSNHAKDVVAVEESEQSATDAVTNAHSNNIKNIRFFASKVEDFLEKLKDMKKSGVVIDPPRSGLSRQVSNRLARLKPEIVVYVSCDVATFSRDSKILTDSGYKLTSIKPFDMFPQTPHIEVVGTFLKV